MTRRFRLGLVACAWLALSAQMSGLAAHGAARLESIFLDEGFGSLDEQTLDEVLDVLDSLRERDRTVGIVSHVADLRQRIPARLEVVKGREGSAVRDYHHPPKTVIGEHDNRAGDILLNLYQDVRAPLIRTNIETAEIIKYTDNAWHALKVSFANEIGNSVPISSVDRMKKMFCMQADLMLRSPKPNQI